MYLRTGAHRCHPTCRSVSLLVVPQHIAQQMIWSAGSLSGLTPINQTTRRGIRLGSFIVMPPVSVVAVFSVFAFAHSTNYSAYAPDCRAELQPETHGRD